MNITDLKIHSKAASIAQFVDEREHRRVYKIRNSILFSISRHSDFQLIKSLVEPKDVQDFSSFIGTCSRYQCLPGT